MNDKNFRILVIGDFMTDRYWYCEPAGISPEAPIIKWKVIKKEDHLGGTANVVNNLNSIINHYQENVSISFPAIVNFEQDYLAKKNRIPINDFLIYKNKNRLATVKNRMIYENPYQQIIRWDEDNSSKLTSFEENFIIESILGKEFDIGLVSDYLHGGINRNILEAVRKSCRTVIIDPKGNDTGRYFGIPDIIVPNVKELSDLVPPMNKNDSTEQRVMSLDSSLSSDIDKGVDVILKKGDKGCMLWTRDSGFMNFRKYYCGQVIDTTGAGDTFIAALSFHLLTKSLKDSVVLSNQLAGISVTKPFCWVPYN
jgi:rfaE bifunctional protein kinase chain/domain